MKFDAQCCCCDELSRCIEVSMKSVKPLTSFANSDLSGKRSRRGQARGSAPTNWFVKKRTKTIPASMPIWIIRYSPEILKLGRMVGHMRPMGRMGQRSSGRFFPHSLVTGYLTALPMERKSFRNFSASRHLPLVNLLFTCFQSLTQRTEKPLLGPTWPRRTALS
jgi:hypothetical protein